jgi:hypothetical protein
VDDGDNRNWRLSRRAGTIASIAKGNSKKAPRRKERPVTTNRAALTLPRYTRTPAMSVKMFRLDE